MRHAPLALFGAALLALPWLAGEYYVNLASQILIAAVFALSLNLLVGHCGLTSLGHAAYLGLAAYFSAWFSLRLGLGQLTTAPLALACTTLAAALLGLVALRASGLGFLIITLAMGQVLWGLAFRLASVTGGDNGLSGLTRPEPFGLDLGGATPFYYFTLAIAAAAGPIVGAALVTLLKSYVSAYVERWTMLLGFVFVMIVLFMPDGLVPGLKRAWTRIAGRRA